MKKHITPLSVALILLLVLATVGTTVAYLISHAAPVINTFIPSVADVEVEEDFDGKVKKNVTAANNSEFDAFIRIRLVTYRVSDDPAETGETGVPNRIGGTAVIPPFTLGDDWAEHDGYYYYLKPVAPGEKPATPLIGEPGITLVDKYDDVDGGKQALLVMADLIQAEPLTAIQTAWGVTIENGSLTPYSAS